MTILERSTLTGPDVPPAPAPGARRDPRWVRPSAFVLLGVTAVLYLWNLSASGWANSYYSAAVQAGTQSWTAMFFGSLDAGNLITVDKPPASLWVMEIAARLFGFNAWTVLAPQALEGVAAVGLLYLTVKRWHGPLAGLFAGAALAVTPVAALMFRFNNPDALLTLLLVAAAYALTRAVERAGTRWLLLAGVAIGFAFLTKMLQGFLVLPGFALVYLVAAPTTFWHRLRQLLAAGLAVVVSAGWWVAAVELWPASARPYVGGSTDDSVLELVLGYNGLSRLTGGEGNMTSSGTAGSSFGGETGLARLFSSDMGVDVAWLLPAALVALVLVLVARGRAPRTDRPRAAALLWGGWLLATGVVLSYMQGTVHPYYTVALAPAVAALVAIGGAELWQRRRTLLGRTGLAVLVLAAGGTGYVLLARNPDWFPALRYVVLGLAAVAAVGLLAVGSRPRRTAAAVLLVVGTLAGLAGPTAYAVATAATTHSGSIPTAGPAGASTGQGGGPGDRTGTRPSGGAPTGTAPTSGAPTGTAPTGTAPTGTAPTGGAPTGGAPTGGGTSTSAEVVALLRATTGTWSAATVGAQSAAQLELASGTSVMGIGGWSGSDPAPTLAEFQAAVAAGEVRYFIAGNGNGGGGGGREGTSEITTWVTSTFTATTVGSTTVYDLSASA